MKLMSRIRNDHLMPLKAGIVLLALVLVIAVPQTPDVVDWAVAFGGAWLLLKA